MKEHQILFSDPMVRTIPSGQKTMTRRIFKIGKYAITSPAEEIVKFDDGTFHYLSTAGLSGPYPCPYGQPGDRLWVKENAYYWGRWEKDGLTKTGKQKWRSVIKVGAKVIYQADSKPLHTVLKKGSPGEGWIFRPGMFMPRWASRITLEITYIRVERLQEISQEDARAEGVYSRIVNMPSPTYCAARWVAPGVRMTSVYGEKEFDVACHLSAKDAFACLWDSINTTHPWDSNPCVWVVAFKQIHLIG